MFPQRLDSTLAYDIAKAMIDGFNRHYRLFCAESARAKHRFETADWHGQQRAQRERIEFYDLRVRECFTRLERKFKAGALPILHNRRGALMIDAALFGEDDLLMLFSFARAYFMVEMEIPSAWVQFLRSRMPRKPRTEEEAMSGEVWYTVGPHDVFPETFGPFLLGNPVVREVFLRHHADLLDTVFWQAHKERIAKGHLYDVFPYEQQKRFHPQDGAADAP